MLSHDDVTLVYKAILGREPESKTVLDFAAAQSESAEDLSKRLLNTDEFRRRIAYGLAPEAGSQWACAEIRHGLKLWIDLLDLGVASGVLQNNWEPAETNFILSVLRPGDVFVDVGANVGWFTVLAARAVGPDGRVHAFEPRRDIAARLSDSVRVNDFAGRCTVHAVALGAAPGELRIAVVPSEHNPGHSFLVPGALPDGAQDLGIVPVAQMDSFDLGGPVRLIKVDVEGAEGLVLRGATGVLARDQPIIVSEIFPRWLANVSGMRPSDYLAMLQGNGYRVFHLSELGIGQEIHSFAPGPAGGISEYVNVVALPPRECERFLNQALDHRLESLDHRLESLEGALAAARAACTQQQDRAERAEDRAARAEQTQCDLQRVLESTKAAVATESLKAAAHSEAEMAARREVAAVRATADRLRATLNEAGVRAYRLEIAKRIEREELLARLEQDRHMLTAVATSAESARAAAQRDIEQLHVRLQSEMSRTEAALLERDVILSSTMWRATWPLRQAGVALPPSVRRTASRALRVAWWAATLQLSQRLRARQAAIAALAVPAAAPAIAIVPPPAPAPPMAVPPAPHPIPPCLAGADRPVAMIIDHKWPEPDRDGGSIDAVNLTETLIALGYHVVFAALHGSPETLSYRDQLAARGAHCFGPEDAPSVQAFVERYGDTICLFVLSRHAHGGQYLELIRYNWPHAKIMFNTVDLHFLREEREARLTGNAAVARVARHTREREQFLALKSDVTVVVSPAEKALLSAAVPGANIAVLPLGRPARTSPVPPFEARHDIGFIGGYAHVPNVDAVRFFLSDVWPLVRAELPDCRFLIAGAGLPEGVVSGEDDRVIAQGHVAELDAWFDRVRLTVAPLRYGAGLKGKVVSSLAAGVPCVGSSVAIEGIPVVAGEDTLVADTPEMIAAEIIRLYRDPALWARISEAGRLRAGQVYSLDVYRQNILEMLVGIGLPCITPQGSSPTTG